MTLPDLASQILYGRLGWAIVLATVICAVARASARALSALSAAKSTATSTATPACASIPRATLAAIMAASLVAMSLPGNLSPAWYLGLAFQYPSGLLVGCCLVRLTEHWHGVRRSQAMPRGLAWLLAVAGALLYLDALGVLTRGFYYAGFGGPGLPLMPLVAIAAAGACVLAIVRAQGPRHASGPVRGHAAALLGAIVLFSVLRLPTGNLWDALLDPLLFGWAIVALLAGVLRRSSRRASDRDAAGQVEAEAEAEPVPSPALQPHAAEHFSSLKEQVGGQ